MLLLREIQFLSWGFPCPDLLVGNFTNLSLEISIQLFFFPFLFPSHCCSFYLNVVSAVSSHCNMSFFPFLMLSLSYHIETSSLSSMLVSPYHPSFLDTQSQSMFLIRCKAWCVVINYIYIYIYIVIHRQICFVLLELISVARHISFP